MDRLDGSRARIRIRLEKGPATNGELAAIALRYGARLHELRRAGMRIKTVALGNGMYEYAIVD